jgi:hypothetical protein
MTIRISGSSGVSGVAGTSGAPALAGDPSKLGINFEGDQLNIGFGNTNIVAFDNQGNIESSGIVTATSFVGNVTGDVTGSATNLSGTPGIEVGLTTVTGLDGVAFVAISTTGVSTTLVNREYVTAVGVGTTAAEITITLPASPTVGHEVGVAIGGTFTDTIIARNGSRIMGLDEDMTLDRAYISVQLVYVDTTVGWRFF